MSDTPETDAAWKEGNAIREWTCRKLERERDEALIDRANGDIATMTRNHYERILRERDEWAAMCGRYKQERDEAREQVKDLIYISERAIALAEIDFENDKFGVVSELRSDLAKIKKSK